MKAQDWNDLAREGGDAAVLNAWDRLPDATPPAGDAAGAGLLGRPASELAGLPVPPREWHVAGLIPAGTVTLLSGDGGTGKSLIALQLGVATAAGAPWLGREVRQGRALYLSAEDDRDELHRRLDTVSAAEGIPLADLDALRYESLAGEDALLATLGKGGNLEPTDLCQRLDRTLGSLRPALLVADTLADLFPGNENDRAQARQFVSLLRHLAIEHGCAVLLLSHPSLTGLSSGTGSSGSTAWSNSVRSRLYLSRVVQDGYEADTDARVLSTKKSNYGAAGSEIALRWRGGVFVADEPEGALDRLSSSAKAERVFLRLLDEFTAQGRFVSASPSNVYAPTVFASHPNAEGVTTRAMRAAMESLFHRGEIRVAEHGRGAKVRRHIERASGDV